MGQAGIVPCGWQRLSYVRNEESGTVRYGPRTSKCRVDGVRMVAVTTESARRCRPAVVVAALRPFEPCRPVLRKVGPTSRKKEGNARDHRKSSCHSAMASTPTSTFQE